MCKVPSQLALLLDLSPKIKLLIAGQQLVNAISNQKPYQYTVYMPWLWFNFLFTKMRLDSIADCCHIALVGYSALWYCSVDYSLSLKHAHCSHIYTTYACKYLSVH